jgi:MarR family transcriptional repressor of emrRAB
MANDSQLRTKTISEILANINALKHKVFVSHLQKTPHQKISHSQWFALCIIENKHNVSSKEISQILGISPSAATQLVDALVENGFVTRTINAKDRRSLHLSLSKKGQKNMAKVKEKYTNIMKTLFTNLSNQELQDYNNLQRKILINIPNVHGQK